MFMSSPNQIVALYMTPEESFIVQRLINIQSAILYERLSDFARLKDVELAEELQSDMEELDVVKSLGERLYERIYEALAKQVSDDSEIERFLRNDRGLN